MNDAHEPLGPDALDFWVGDWALAWGDAGVGTNRIERAAAGRVIMETFEGHGPNGTLHGLSVSVRQGDAGPWRQTWVDSSGAYLNLIGIEVDGRIAFQRTTVENGQAVVQRMVWLDVEPTSFRWEWQRSVDQGRTWETGWEIRYRRR